MRNIIYIDIYTTLQKDGSPAVLNVSRETLYQSDMLSILADALEGSRKDKAEYFISFLGLKYYTTIIINFLYKLEYNLNNNVSKDDLHVKEYRLRQSPNGQTYYIQIKTGKKSYVTFQGVDAVIGLKQLPENDDDAIRAMSLYHYVRDEFLSDCKNSDTRLLFSSASISKTMFGRENPEYLNAIKGFKKLSLYIDKDETEKKRLNVFLEDFCRPAVHGGFCYLSNLGRCYSGPGVVVDDNSLYPYIASDGTIPIPALEKYGHGTEGINEYLNPKRYYIIMKVTVTAELKEDGLPCISSDGDNNIGRPHYLNKMKKRTLTLTPSDRRLLFSNYNIYYYSIQEYIVFPCRKGLFKKYVQPKYEIKRTAEKGSLERDFVKLLINGFIGFFARSIYTTEYDYELTEDGFLMPVKVAKTPEEYNKERRNVSGACFINMAIVSQAKEMMVNIIKKHQDRFLYTDTDSIHLKGTEIPGDITVSDRMGDFKIEHVFSHCYYKSEKNYILVENNKIVQCISGIPKDTLEHIKDLPGVDKRYIDNAIKHLHIEALYNKPVTAYTIGKDITTGDIYYEFYPTMFYREYKRKKIHEKTPEERKIEEAEEWVDNHKTTPKMWRPYIKARQEREKQAEKEYQIFLKQIDDIIGTDNSIYTL